MSLHPRRIAQAAFLFAVFGLVPAAALAGRQFDALQKDAAMFQSVVDQEKLETATENKEETLDLVTDLLVDMSGSGQTTVREPMEADPFVTFRENGVQYQLKDVP